MPEEFPRINHPKMTDSNLERMLTIRFASGCNPKVSEETKQKLTEQITKILEAESFTRFVVEF